MNETITTAHLKALLSANAHVDELFVNLFLDEFVKLIVETVLRGEEVHIDGLGTFKPVTIRQGEESRMIFIADDQFKAEVNAPFSQFIPIILKKESQEDSTQHVSVDTTLSSTEPIHSDVVITEASSETPESSNLFTNKPNSMDEQEKKAVDKEYEEKLTPLEGSVDVSDGNGQMQERVEKVAEKSVSEETGQSCKSVGCNTSKKLVAKKTGLYFVIILLAICVLGTMVYFFVRVFNSEDKAVQQTEEIEVVSQRSEETPSNTYTVPSNEKEIQEDSVSLSPVNTDTSLPKESFLKNANDSQYPIQITLKPGQRLTLLALKYYGNKNFWVYIYEYNKQHYADPNNLPVGAKILIPNPALYHIDATNKESVNAAKKLSEEY